jgi:hypothetical protein
MSTEKSSRTALLSFESYKGEMAGNRDSRPAAALMYERRRNPSVFHIVKGLGDEAKRRKRLNLIPFGTDFTAVTGLQVQVIVAESLRILP